MEAASPAEARSLYLGLKESKEEAATLALYRLIRLDGQHRSSHFQTLLAKNPPRDLLEAAFKEFLDAGDPKALDWWPSCQKKFSAGFAKKAEKTLVRIRFLNRPAERARVIQDAFRGKSAYVRVVVGRLCEETGTRLPERYWPELFRACLQARDLDLAGRGLPHLKASKPNGNDYLLGRYHFLKRDYATAVSYFQKVTDGDEDHPYQEGRCWLMLKDSAKAREAFSRVGGNLLPLGRLSLVRVALTDGDVEGALTTARTIPSVRTKRDALLSCAVAIAFGGDKARALRLLKDIKADAEILYWRSRWEGREDPDLSPRGSPFNFFQVSELKAPVPWTDVVMPDGADPHTFPEFLLSRGLYADARYYLDRLTLDPAQEAFILEQVGEHRREVSAIYPEASRMLAGPTAGWDMRVLSRFFPRAFEGSVRKACAESGVPPELVWAVMRQESAFHPEALSPAGAMGLMQLIPPTWAENSEPDENPWDTEQNIASGVRYLKKLHAQFGDWVHVAAAYNAGEDAVRSWLRIPATADGPAFCTLIPFAETRAYVRAVLYNMLMYRLLYVPPGKE
jgi:tetratricopeptide (TPR) repeat protein